MRIKTRIQLGIILSLVLAGTIGLLLFLGTRAVNEANRKAGIADQVAKGVAELKIVTHEYLLHPEERSLMQWRSRYSSLSKLLTGGHFKNPDEKIAADQIFKNLERFKTVFFDLTTDLRKGEALGQQESSAFRELQDRLMDELLMKSRLAVSLAFQLHQDIDAKSVTTQRRVSLLTILLLLTLTAAIVGISLWINRSIGRPIAKLEKDARIIGSGNLDHKVGTTAKDEIGQFSRAFDKMTAALKKSTTSIVELNQEIDERKQTEARLRESEVRFRAQYEGSPIPAFTWQRTGEDFVLVGYNHTANEVTHGEARKYLGKSANEMYQNRREILEDLHRCLAEKRVIRRDLVAQDFMPGRYIMTNYAFVPPDLVIVHVVDMTDRKQAEDALRESETEKKAILDASIDRIRLVDRDLRIIWANKTTTMELDITPGELAGKLCYEVFAERDTPCPECPIIKALKSGKIEQAVLHQTKSKGIIGDSYWDTYAVPIKDASGDVVNLVEISRNITERKQGEEEKERLHVQIRRSQKMEAISTLAGGIAHDFNNILSAIIGYTQLAHMKLDPESEPYADLKQVLQSGNRATGLIQQILAVGRSQEQETHPMQFKYIVREALKFLRSTLPSTIEIREKIDKDVGVIDADPTQMHQVIMNLCTNAGHAMDENGGILEVSLQNVDFGLRNADLKAEENKSQSSDHKVAPSGLEPGQYLELTVSDTGYGIAPEIREKIFDPYFTTKEPGVGTGIGLSVVHGIVIKHGGDITVETEPRKGSTFHVYLPLTQAEEEQPEVKEETPFPKGNERILFIDDEAVLARMGKEMLNALGYDVTSMTSSIESLALFKEDPKRFDLVITDTTMPHMPGDILAQKIMEIRPDIPVIICTGHSKRISREKAEEMGIRGFLMKPLAMRDLAETVRKVLVTIDD